MSIGRFDKYISDPEYRQLLYTIFYHIGHDIFPILDAAESSGKRLSVKKELDEIIVSSIDLV